MHLLMRASIWVLVAHLLAGGVTVDEHTSPAINVGAGPAGSTSGGFESPEGLRALLLRLHKAGPGAWRGDREAADLMRYTAAKYRPLARKHGLDSREIASAKRSKSCSPLDTERG